MPRSVGGVRTSRRHNKVLKLAKGFRGTRSKLFKRAQEAVLRAGEHAFAGRRKRRRDIRRLWISRINAGLTQYNIQYSRFIKGLKEANIDVDRKILADLAATDPKAFEQVVQKVKASFKIG